MDGKLLRLLVATIAISALFSLHSNCQQSFSAVPSSGNSSEHLRNMILTDTNLIVGSSKALYRLDLDLVQLQRRVLNAPNRLLVADPNGTYNRSVLACGTVECVLVSLSDLDATSWEIQREGEVMRNGSEDVSGMFAIGANGSSDLMVAENEEGNQGARIIRGSLLNVGNSSASYSFRTYAIRPELRFSLIDFLFKFSYQGFIYLVAQFGDTETRIIRFCQSDPGSPISQTFASQYEITLQCTTDDEGKAISATLVESSSVFPDPTLLVMKSGMISPGTREMRVCAYSLVEINRLMLEKFDSCNLGEGVSGFTRDSNPMVCNPLSAAQLANADPCMLRGSRSIGLEVDPESPLVAVTPVLARSLTGGDNYTTLVDAVLDGSLFVFAASHRGLDQFHIRGPTESVFVRHIDLSPLLPLALNESLTSELLSSPSGEHIFSLTPTKVLRHTVDMCSSFTSCEACTTSHDPVCGWCTLHGSCTRQSSCPSVEDRLGTANTVWLAIGMNDSCPMITGATPPTIYYPELASTLVGSRTLSLATANIDGRYDYQCVFNFEDSSIVFREALQNGDSFTCIAPTSSEIPPLGEGEDTVFSTVFLRSIATSQNVITLETPLNFTKCSLHTSCTSCIASSCRWCPFSFECVPEPSNIGNCSAPLNQPSIHAGSQCPSILPPSPQERNYLVHANHTYQQSQLRILAASLSGFLEHFERGEFRCEICIDAACTDVLAVLAATVNPQGTEVTCVMDTLMIPGTPIPRFDTTLRIVWNSDHAIDNPSQTGITVYSCAHLGRNCGECLAIEARYDCAFCSSTCALTQMPACTSSSSSSSPASMLTDPADVDRCGTPLITSFHPTAGPVDGGTEVTVIGSNLGASAEDIVRVTIGSVNCSITSITPGVSLRCVTDVVMGNRFSSRVSVLLDYRNEAIASEEQFAFVIPRLSSSGVIHPSQGPLSGGTRITITGSMVGVGSSHSVLIASQDCTDVEVTANSLTCVTAPSGSALPTLNALVEVRVDNWSARSDFNYSADPVFSSIQPNSSFAAGGTNYTVIGQNLNVVLEPRLLFYLGGVAGGVAKRQVEQIIVQSEVCKALPPPMSGTSMVCRAPPLPSNLSSGVSIGLLMDGVVSLRELNATVTVHTDPQFFLGSSQLTFGQDDDIQLLIEGSGFIFTSDQVTVSIAPCPQGGGCTCDVISVFTHNNSLLCEVTSPKDLPTDELLTVSASLGNTEAVVYRIRITESPDLLVILIPVFAAVLVLCVAVFMVVFAVFCRKTRQKDRRYDQLILELEKLESSVARECKLGFAELQTDLDELTGDIAGCRLPYHDLQTYLLNTLFPGARDHPILHPLNVPQNRLQPTRRALRDFNEIVFDKKALLVLIRTLEEQRGFTIRDKSVVGSLLVVVLHKRMDYATAILRTLLTTLIRKTVSNSHGNPKLLLRRTESVAERMLSNWLAFCLHGYIMEHAGQPMYLLYRAVKTQLEKGPMDVITGEARYSLSEQKLIRHKIDVEVINATVETEDGLRIPVKVLDCDTISQTKEKLLDAVFKAAPVSQRPSLTSVDLEYIKSAGDEELLRDEDRSTQLEGGWKSINTLRHCRVVDGAHFRLVPRRDYAPPGRTYDYPASLISTHSPRQRALSEAEDGTRVWHLFKQLDVEDPKRSPFLNKKMVTEIYLPRMLSTKSILQKFVDDLFHSLFSIAHSPSSPTNVYTNFFTNSPGVQVPMGYAPGAEAVPMAIKYLFDLLDDEAEAAKISDPDVVHAWKNNAISLRFWVNMIKNPEFVFDINKSHTVDACLSVIAQAFIDGCSTAEVKLTIDSPTSKLLYNKEVQGYKARVKAFYRDIKELPRVPEDAMQYYLKQLSTYQTQMMSRTKGFVSESALYELLRYGMKYHEQFVSNLRSAGMESKAQLFEGVLRDTL